MISRRDFITYLLKGLAVSFLPSLSISCQKKGYSSIAGRKALYFKNIDKETVQCLLCPNQCVIAEGERSPCLVRENRKGELYTLVFGNPCAVHIDPIEKKPFFHVLPQARAFSLATAGCNFHCKNCQNWEISQYPPEETNNLYYPPEKIAEEAQATGCEVVSYTYTEPSIFYEYMLETAKLVKEKNLLNTMHSNGYLNEKPLREVATYLGAANIDLKSISPDFYDEVCDGELRPVLRTLEILKEEGVFLEITHLVISGLNDREAEFKKLCRWIKNNLGEETPVHFSRFYPMYRLNNLPPTPVPTLEKARQIALDNGLLFAYIGNVPGHPAESTYCPSCGRTLIKRTGFTVEEYHLNKSACEYCKKKIPGIWRD